MAKALRFLILSVVVYKNRIIAMQNHHAIETNTDVDVCVWERRTQQMGGKISLSCLLLLAFSICIFFSVSFSTSSSSSSSFFFPSCIHS